MLNSERKLLGNSFLSFVHTHNPQSGHRLCHRSKDGIVPANTRSVLLIGGFSVTHLIELGLWWNIGKYQVKLTKCKFKK